MGRIVSRGAANAPRYLGDGYFRPTSILIDDLRVAKGTEKTENYARSSLRLVLQVHLLPFPYLISPSPFFIFIWISAMMHLYVDPCFVSLGKYHRIFTIDTLRFLRRLQFESERECRTNETIYLSEPISWSR